MLFTRVARLPGDGVWIKRVGYLADIGMDHRNAAVTAPIPIARKHSRLDVQRRVPKWIALDFWNFLRVTPGLMKPHVPMRRLPVRIDPVPDFPHVSLTKQGPGNLAVAVQMSLRRSRKKLAGLEYGWNWLLDEVTQTL
ncbi:hypothetical protein ATY79_29450 [Rhizobium sp. R693]|nr:hypothetical protein ATY79_29450 [Rhizobium sp. R693]